MAALRAVRPVNLFCGLISNDPDLMARAVRTMVGYWGATEAITEQWAFDSTDYYEVEMGEGLLKQFVSFEKLIDPGALASIKLTTNELERQICQECGLPTTQRRVNLDPGYLTLSKIVLATTKDFSHRLYLRDGIYAESTLHWERGQWTSWPWTYPDFGGGQYFAFFSDMRERYRRKLNALEHPSKKGASE